MVDLGVAAVSYERGIPVSLGCPVSGGFAGHLEHDRHLGFRVEGSALSLQRPRLVDLSAAGRM